MDDSFNDDCYYVAVEDSKADIPPVIPTAEDSLIDNLLPERSKERYEIAYQRFMDYRLKNNIDSFTEGALLTYLTHLSTTLKGSTLFAIYSMLRSTLTLKHDVDISKYTRLRAFLKKQNVGCETKKASLFNQEQIEKFIMEAPDEQYLLIKVAAIFGIAGACCRNELSKMSINEVENLGSKLLITIPNTKTNKPRAFIINEKYFPICDKYMAMRPSGFSHRFFFNVRNGKVIKQAIGIHTFGKMPQIIAKYLNLPKPESYTGYSFRLSSATILADNDENRTANNREVAWTPIKVAEDNMLEDIEDSKTGIIPITTAETTSATTNLLPEKSKDRYEVCYQRFMEYCKKKNINSFSEKVLLTYLVHLSSTFKASTLWGTYSMLRGTLLSKHNVDISTYATLKKFLKKRNVGFVKKKATKFNQEQIEQFMMEAPDETYLLIKAVAVVGIAGSCSRDELCKMSINDIENLGSKLLITIPDANTHKPRSFMVNERYFPICQKYMALRPTKFCDRFFFNIRNGKVCKQPIGIHSFGKMPQIIATYLKLPKPETYTGHSFRRSSAAILADFGVPITTIFIKREDEEKNTNVADDYTFNSKEDCKAGIPFITETADSSTANLLPEKSKDRYEICYQRFIEYRQENNIDSFTEPVLMAYSAHLSTTLKGTTLWAIYSMLRSTLLLKHDIDISKYEKLKAFIKKQNVGCEPKKSSLFTLEQIDKFIMGAPDEPYLLMKVATIFAITGGCRRHELTKMSIKDIQNLGSKLLITIPDSKTHKPRSFIVNEKYFHICQQYMALRPQGFHDRFFFNIRHGKAVKQPIGIHTFGKMPQLVAKYLKLPKPETYTSHSYRRFSTIMLVDNARNATAPRRGDRKSASVPEENINPDDNIEPEDNIDHSINIKIETEDNIIF